VVQTGDIGLTRAVVRTVLIVVTVVLTLYVLFLLRGPLSWLVIAGFIAIAVSGPVNFFQRYMKRGLAIAIVYLLLVLVPALLGALIIPPIVNQAEDFAQDVPGYVADIEEFVNENETLADLEEEFDVTSKLQDLAADAPGKIGDAAGTLKDIGVGIVNSLFAAFTILILSIFMVGGGPRWREAFLKAQPGDRAERMRNAFDHIGQAIGNYVGGALVQATLAGVSSFIVLSILDAPFAAPLAVLVAFFDLIPVVGATLAAVLVAVVMIFVNFPVGLIVWVVYAIVYQQVENYVIQPQIQKRAVAVEPFVILVAVLFGASLFGVPGAILAIPTAASIQIAIRELLAYRRESRLLKGETPPAGADPPGPPSPPGAAEAPA
jgi:predicted PurR-regulated permease PerM